jgi:hypothetical protein
LTANRGQLKLLLLNFAGYWKKGKRYLRIHVNSEEYAILDWLQGEAKGYDTVERKTWIWKKKEIFNKQRFAEFKGIKLYEPQLESGVHAL